jgi:hypothetical protein
MEGEGNCAKNWKHGVLNMLGVEYFFKCTKAGNTGLYERFFESSALSLVASKACPD